MLPDQYVFLVLSVFLFGIITPILLFRPDLVKPALISGLFGGVAGFFAQVFYAQDYWTAPMLFGIDSIRLDNFLFGFSITALCVILYPALSRQKYIDAMIDNSKFHFFSLFLTSLAILVLLLSALNVNSVVASSFIFVIDAIALWLKDRRLIRQSIITAAIVTPLLFFIYLVIGSMAPEYLEKYWHLYYTSLGIRIVTHVPLLELVWYFSWALFGSIGYRFLFSKELASIDKA